MADEAVHVIRETVVDGRKFVCYIPKSEVHQYDQTQDCVIAVLAATYIIDGDNPNLIYKDKREDPKEPLLVEQ